MTVDGFRAIIVHLNNIEDHIGEPYTKLYEGQILLYIIEQYFGNYFEGYKECLPEYQLGKLIEAVLEDLGESLDNEKKEKLKNGIKIRNKAIHGLFPELYVILGMEGTSNELNNLGNRKNVSKGDIIGSITGISNSGSLKKLEEEARAFYDIVKEIIGLLRKKYDSEINFELIYTNLDNARNFIKKVLIETLKLEIIMRIVLQSSRALKLKKKQTKHFRNLITNIFKAIGCNNNKDKDTIIDIRNSLCHDNLNELIEILKIDLKNRKNENIYDAILILSNSDYCNLASKIVENVTSELKKQLEQNNWLL